MEDAPGFGLFDLEAITDMEEHTKIVDLTEPDEDDDEDDLLPDDLSPAGLKG
jgi:hypothetical protein